jgi:methylated-DNA-[protein]-cysteine S-methyltransferase
MTEIRTPHDVERLDVSTALGTFRVTASPRGVRGVMPVARAELTGPPRLDTTRAAASALVAYAAGETSAWQGALDADASWLERAVWDHLRALPFGATTTYGAIAAAIGRPGEARAVGDAVGANRACVLVPCHRVVGADGSLRGFRWGLDLKRRLLAHEGSGTLVLPL